MMLTASGPNPPPEQQPHVRKGPIIKLRKLPKPTSELPEQQSEIRQTRLGKRKAVDYTLESVIIPPEIMELENKRLKAMADRIAQAAAEVQKIGEDSPLGKEKSAGENSRVTEEEEDWFEDRYDSLCQDEDQEGAVHDEQEEVLDEGILFPISNAKQQVYVYDDFVTRQDEEIAMLMSDLGSVFEDNCHTLDTMLATTDEICAMLIPKTMDKESKASKGKLVLCPLCKKYFDSQRGLAIHNARLHNMKKK